MKSIWARWKNLSTVAKIGVLIFAPLIVPVLLLCSVMLIFYFIVETTDDLVFGRRK